MAKRGLSWLGLSCFFGSKLLVYRYAAEKFGHMSYGVVKNTVRLPETQMELKLSKRSNTV